MVWRGWVSVLAAGLLLGLAGPASAIRAPRRPADPPVGGRHGIFEVRYSSSGSTPFGGDYLSIYGPRGTKCAGSLLQAEPIGDTPGKTYIRFFTGTFKEQDRRQERADSNVMWFSLVRARAWCPGYYRGRLFTNSGEGVSDTIFRYFYFTVR